MLQTQVSISADLRIEHFQYLDPDFLPPFRNNVQCPVQSGDLHGARSGDTPGRASFHLCVEGPKKPDQALSVICIRRLQVP